MRVPLRHSLTGRLLLLGVIPMVALATTLVAVGILEKSRTLRAVGESRILQTLQYSRSIVEDRYNDAARSARFLAGAEAAGAWRNPTETRAILENVLAPEEQLTAAWVIIEAAADSAATGWKAVVDPNAPERLSVTADVSAAQSEAYRAARRGFDQQSRPSLTVGEPTDRDNGARVQFVFPIIVDGEFRGAAGAEYATQDMAEGARSIASRDGVQVYLLSAGGRFVVTSRDKERTTAPLRARLLSDTSFATTFAPLLTNDDARGTIVLDDPETGEPTYYASATGKTGGPFIVIAKPVGDVTAPIAAEIARNTLIAGLGLVIVSALVVLLSVTVSRRLSEAVFVATAIAGGDLSARAKSTAGRDESALLLQSLDVMAERLQTLVGAVHAASSTVDRGVYELVRVTQGQRTAVMPLNQTTTEVAAAARQISTTSEELAGTMRSLEESESSTAELAEHSRTNLSGVDGSMRDLDGATLSVAEKLAAINEKAVAINCVVTTITKVADQTNILSVNAAIEAEKAGEQGRGFLVVAREIRRLADQTADATLEIARMVEEMQSAVSAGVMEMDRFSEKVRRGVEQVARSSGRMAEIIGQVRENSQAFRAVTEGMASQSAGAGQISEATAQLRESARSTVDGVSRIATTARVLEDASESLRSAVSAFGLEGASCSLALEHVQAQQQPVDGASVL